MTRELPTADDVVDIPAAEGLRAVFDAAPAYTIGIEDEVMLLDPDTLELVPLAGEVLSGLGDDPRFKLELPASQLEILTPPRGDATVAASALREAREVAAAGTEGLVRLAAAGVHPFSSGIGELNRVPRYERTIEEYGRLASRQLVCALQVHVSIGDSERALAVYNALRAFLPLLAALGANAPFYEGQDTGLASARPKLAELLPRQGVPPPIDSWEHYVDMLRWGVRSGAFPDFRSWWWELRPHPRFGTLELRVADSQSGATDVAALAAVAHTLVVWLGERHDAGESLPVAEGWRIEQNRWSAARRGVEGKMADLVSGERQPTREFLYELVQTLEPTARRLGNEPGLNAARRLIEVNGAVGQRQAARTGGAFAATRWLTERFLQ